MNDIPGLTLQQFEALSLNLGIGSLMLYMAFIIYRLARESGAGRFGTLIIALSLGLGLVGYIAKTIIPFTLEVQVKIKDLTPELDPQLSPTAITLSFVSQ